MQRLIIFLLATPLLAGCRQASAPGESAAARGEVKVVRNVVEELVLPYHENALRFDAAYNRGQTLELHFYLKTVAKDARGWYLGAGGSDATIPEFPNIFHAYLKPEAEAEAAQLKALDLVVVRGTGLEKLRSFTYAGKVWPVLAVKDCTIVRKTPFQP